MLAYLMALAITTPVTADREAFIDEMVNQHQFDRAEVTAVLERAELNQEVLDAIQRPWEAKPWYQYHPIFLTEKRLAAGLKFWQQHADTLARAEAEFGVPAAVIVAIIGVETFYGEYKGKYPVLDALFTLGFHYPPRAKFFRSELQQYLLLTREEKLDLNELKGSYAGAMGYGQFISSSYRHYAIDFDGDGVRDLLSNPVDAIGSVANYFARHGWQAGKTVAIELPEHSTHADLVTAGMKPEQTIAALQEQGLQLPQGAVLDAAQRAKVFAFDQPDSVDYWLGLQNFYVITRYNHSPLYAMVVHQFSEQLARNYHDQESSPE
ncbi:lytic murein transglycosylase B [Pseudidiomarina aestuarii]|uniref:Lytic murein transglycosylase B n=1 Tax=Pseudidiomarina aestuarii TaxID=624146 RepID=A0A7Z7ETU5_9GAMM|nr:lytic murein transglycosylase B [Pseudidiomarina aestuarii]RUO41395.1 lytic murein transglycosylase B [Pseudidiomarina aestuarii]